MNKEKKIAWKRVNTNNFRRASVVAVIAMLIIPLPSGLLDFLMATNILFALVLLFIVFFTPRIANLSFFPTMMLVSSVLTLGLNVSSTRLILTLGSKFDGRMIRAFCSNEMDGIIIIGFVIFIIFTIIQTLITTKGTPHISRLAVHLIAEKEKRPHDKIEESQELDFYNSMNDAVNCSRAIVKKGLFITVINLVAGIGFGMVLRDETFDKAIQTYVALTIGDGLIAQLPPFLISLAVSCIVIRLIKQALSDKSMDDGMKRQFAQNTKIYIVGGITMIIISLLAYVGVTLLAYGYALSHEEADMILLTSFLSPWFVLLGLFYLGLELFCIGSDLKYKIVKPHATGFLEREKEEYNQLKDEKWLKTRQLDENHAEQIAIDMTGPAYDSYGKYNEHIDIRNKGEAEKNEIILKKLSAKWNDIFERKDFFEGITFNTDVWEEHIIGNLPNGSRFEMFSKYPLDLEHNVGNLPNGILVKLKGAIGVWNDIASAIKSKRLEISYSSLEYTTKDNKSISIGIKKAAFGAVIVLSFIGDETTIKMHIYITPHGVPALPDLRESDIIDAQINVKLPKNKADAKKITLDDIFTKLGVEKFWEKTQNFEDEVYAACREARTKKIEENMQKQIENSKEKVQADMEKLNEALSEMDSI